VKSANMTAPMLLPMLHYRNPVLGSAEMGAAMVVPAVVAGLDVVGLLDAGHVMTVAHFATFPAMSVVMLRRYRLHAG
jgi:hypothetical protein